MHSTRKLAPLVALTLVCVAVVALPGRAHALGGIGAEGFWAPWGADTLAGQGELTLDTYDDTRRFDSGGLNLQLTLGIEAFSVGVKVNLVRHAYRDSEISYTEFTPNLLLLSQFPEYRTSFYVEGGPAMSLDIGGVGYNFGGGARFSIVRWKGLDIYVTAGVLYSDLPVDKEFGAYDVRGLRVVGGLGGRFSL
jgi:hypothetical protein